MKDLGSVGQLLELEQRKSSTKINTDRDGLTTGRVSGGRTLSPEEQKDLQRKRCEVIRRIGAEQKKPREAHGYDAKVRRVLDDYIAATGLFDPSNELKVLQKQTEAEA